VPPPPAANVAGTERFKWTQIASNKDELSTFRYAAYVDGIRVDLTDVSCGPPSSQTSTEFECNAPLPPMSAGTHTLELAVTVIDGSSLRRSQRSAPLIVTKAGAETPPAPR
jgi:hypothetical protein